MEGNKLSYVECPFSLWQLETLFHFILTINTKQIRIITETKVTCCLTKGEPRAQMQSSNSRMSAHTWKHNKSSSNMNKRKLCAYHLTKPAPISIQFIQISLYKYCWAQRNFLIEIGDSTQGDHPRHQAVPRILTAAFLEGMSPETFLWILQLLF